MRVRLKNQPHDYVHHWRDHRWDANWVERPRLWASAVALALAAPKTVADLACGDAAVVMTAHAISPIEKAYLGDISPDTLGKLVPADLPFEVEKKVADIGHAILALPRVDALVMTEILEHLDNPDWVLGVAREKASWLVASSPIVPDGNDH